MWLSDFESYGLSDNNANNTSHFETFLYTVKLPYWYSHGNTNLETNPFVFDVPDVCSNKTTYVGPYSNPFS